MKRRIVLAIAVSAVVIGAFAGLVAARLFVFNFHRIPQDGMYPGLPAGSLFFSWRNPYSEPSDVRKGDIVVFIKTIDGQEYKFIWRVIGLPGDQVTIDGETVVINRQPLKRERLREERDLVIYRETCGDASYEVAYPQKADYQDQPKASLTVPTNSFYVLGDNRFDALDSRFEGPISFDSIVGKKIGN